MAANNALPAYTFTVDRYQGDIVQYTGMVCASLTLSFQQGGALKYDSTWIGKGFVSGVTFPTLTLETFDPYTLTAQIQRLGVDFLDVIDYSIAINNGIKVKNTINNTAEAARIIFGGPRTVAFSGNADYNAETLLLDKRNFLARAWSISHVQVAATRQLTFNLPTTFMNDAFANVSGSAEVGIPFSGQAMYDGVTAKALDAVMINNQSPVY